MRFLLFNIVVAGALAFLAFGNPKDIRAVADRAHEVAATVKDRALSAVGRDTPEKAAAAPVAASTPAARPVRKVTPAPKQAAAAPPPAPKTAPAPVRTAGTTTAPAPVPPPAAKGKDGIDVASLPPAVAKRRAEVLGDGPVPAETVVDQGVASAGDGSHFMSPAERQRDLMNLSEDMELFSAEAIGQ